MKYISQTNIYIYIAGIVVSIWDCSDLYHILGGVILMTCSNFIAIIMNYDREDEGYRISHEIHYVYDGWNLIQETRVDEASSNRTSYLWGTDLSGSLQSAGGIGGLLAIKEDNSPDLLPLYDGNGNVMGLISAATTLDFVDSYEYGPFGESIRAEGTINNPFRFSTKYVDWETGLLYYGYRYYNSKLGRWSNRDPIEENGGINIYVFLDYITHDGLRINSDDSQSVGFHPVGELTFWQAIGSLWPWNWYDGEVVSPDWLYVRGESKRLYRIRLDDCKYDIDVFNECMNDLIDLSDDNTVENGYHLFWRNCKDWRNDQIRDCKWKSRL